MMSFIFLVLFIIGPEYLFHQPVPYHIFLIQFDMSYTINILQNPNRCRQSAALIPAAMHRLPHRAQAAARGFRPCPPSEPESNRTCRSARP